MRRRWRRPAVFIPRRRHRRRADHRRHDRSGRQRPAAGADAETIAWSTAVGFRTQYMDPTTGRSWWSSGGAARRRANVYVVTTRKQMLAALLEQQQPDLCHHPMRR